MATNLVIYFGTDTKKHGRDNYMRYVFNENILNVLKPLDLTYNIDPILDILTGDVKGKQSKDAIKTLFNDLYLKNMQKYTK